MRVIIAGSRDVEDYEFLKKTIKESGFNISEVVSGDYRGVDKLAERYAKENNLPYKPFPADWEKHGICAGPIRNEEMAGYAEALIAIPDKKSKGTRNMIKIAEERLNHIYIAKYEEEK